jgi:hypothetical protein
LKAEFFARAMAIDKHTEALVNFTATAKEKWSGVESWGAFGLCWGGKVRFPLLTPHRHLLAEVALTSDGRRGNTEGEGTDELNRS